MDTGEPAWKIAAVAWILQRETQDLDSRQAACAKKWKLSLGAAPSGGFRSCVRECTVDGRAEVVLKVTVTLDEAVLEARALQLWEPTAAAVRLLDADLECGALLLERLRPATPLPGGDESQALEVAADLLTRLHSVGSSDAFPSLADLYPHLAEHSMVDIRYERETRGEPMRAAGGP
jgi:streptomycin 6-kinase